MPPPTSSSLPSGQMVRYVRRKSGQGGEGEALEYSDRWPTAVHRLLPRVTKTIKRVRAKKKEKEKKCVGEVSEKAPIHWLVKRKNEHSNKSRKLDWKPSPFRIKKTLLSLTHTHSKRGWGGGGQADQWRTK